MKMFSGLLLCLVIAGSPHAKDYRTFRTTPNIFGGRNIYSSGQTIRTMPNRLGGESFSNGWYSYKEYDERVYYKRY